MPDFVQQLIQLVTSLAILPRGMVKNEGTFFLLLAVLIALIILAMILRRRRQQSDVAS
jgi:hypothetical protein